MKNKILYHYSKEPWTFNPKHVYPGPKGYLNKPAGFWLSDDSDHGWADWCRAEDYCVDGLTYRKAFEVDLTRVRVLTGYDDIQAFTAVYRGGGQLPMDDLEFYLNWEKISKLYAGLLITPYCWSARLDFMWYYGWDCASACVWDLTAVREVPIDFEVKKDHIEVKETCNHGN